MDSLEGYNIYGVDIIKTIKGNSKETEHIITDKVIFDYELEIGTIMLLHCTYFRAKKGFLKTDDCFRNHILFDDRKAYDSTKGVKKAALERAIRYKEIFGEKAYLTPPELRTETKYLYDELKIAHQIVLRETPEVVKNVLIELTYDKSGKLSEIKYKGELTTDWKNHLRRKIDLGELNNQPKRFKEVKLVKEFIYHPNDYEFLYEI